jgi:hypothetical protein
MAAGLYMGALIVALVFILFLPRVAGDAARRLRRSYWTCLLTGLVAFPLFPILAGLAAVTGVGLALAGVLAAAGFLAFYLGHLAAALWLGSALLQRRGEQSFGSVFPALVAGLLIPYAMLLVPALGLFAGFALSLAGAGALILEAAGRKAGPVPPPLTAN